MRRFAFCVLLLLAIALVAAVGTVHWPLVGDTAIMHYIVLAISKGQIPYSHIRDVNMPGTYLLEYLGMSVFGRGALGWRIYDLFLCFSLGVAMELIAAPKWKLAGVFAGCLFFFLHVRDGMAELGQRDLTAAVLLMFSCAFSLMADRNRERLFAVALSGAFASLALLIKPTLAPGWLVLLVFLSIPWLDQRHTPGRRAAGFLAGALLPILLTFAALWRWHAVKAFLDFVSSVVLLHGSLDRQPFSYFLLHPLPSSVFPLAVVVLLLTALRWGRKSWIEGLRHADRVYVLLFGLALAGFVSLVMQGKALPYHRYPEDAFFLLLCGLALQSAIKKAGTIQWIAVAGCVASLVLGLQSTIRALHYQAGAATFVGMLTADLRAGGATGLSGKVQCIDYTAGCLNALYDLGIVESTGTLYDCYLFGPVESDAEQRSRRIFLSEYVAARPRLLIVSDQDCYRANSYDKMRRWPEFYADVQAHYTLVVDRVLTEPVRWASVSALPQSYRIYALKDGAVERSGVSGLE